MLPKQARYQLRYTSEMNFLYYTTFCPIRQIYDTINLYEKKFFPMTDTLQKLRALEKRMYGYRYVMHVIEIDEAAVAPSGGNEGRGEALEIFSSAPYNLIAGDELPHLLDAAKKENLDEQAAAEVRELLRMHNQITKVPATEYVAGTRLMTNARNAGIKRSRLTTTVCALVGESCRQSSSPGSVLYSQQRCLRYLAGSKPARLNHCRHR